MDTHIATLLSSPEKIHREKGIKALAQYPTQETLDSLTDLYDTEDDPDLKALMVKAGRYIKKSMTEATAATDSKKEEQPKRKPQKVEVSATAQRNARGMMDGAMNLIVTSSEDKAEKNRKRAETMVFKAYQLDPNLQHEDYYNAVAGRVLEIPPEYVVDYISEAQQSQQRGGWMAKLFKKS